MGGRWSTGRHGVMWTHGWRRGCCWIVRIRGCGLGMEGRELGRGRQGVLGRRGGTLMGGHHSAGGNVGRWWGVVLSESVGVKTRGAWASVATGMDGERREGCAAGAALVMSNGWLAGTMGRHFGVLGAALLSMAFGGLLGAGVGGAWASSWDTDGAGRRVWGVRGASFGKPAGGLGGGMVSWCSTCSGAFSPSPSIGMGGSPGRGVVSTAWVVSWAPGVWVGAG